MEQVSKFQERLLEAFRERRISQKELSELTGISRPLINMYLKGKCESTNVNCIKLAYVLNVSAAWLAGFDVARDSESRASLDIKAQINDILEELTVEQLQTLLALIKTFRK